MFWNAGASCKSEANLNASPVFELIVHPMEVTLAKMCYYQLAWNNGKSGAKLDLTSLTKPGLQIHKFDHTRTANLCDWLPCLCAALPLVGCLSATSPSC